LSDDKNRIEYEYKQKNEHLNKQNNDNLRDLHSLQDAYNEKIILNKKLYSELDNLERVVDTKNEQNSHLTRQLDQGHENNARLFNEKLVLEKNVTFLFNK
jgi:chromosome segregation ATPase